VKAAGSHEAASAGMLAKLLGHGLPRGGVLLHLGPTVEQDERLTGCLQQVSPRKETTIKALLKRG